MCLLLRGYPNLQRHAYPRLLNRVHMYASLLPRLRPRRERRRCHEVPATVRYTAEGTFTIRQDLPHLVFQIHLPSKSVFLELNFLCLGLRHHAWHNHVLP